MSKGKLRRGNGGYEWLILDWEFIIEFRNIIWRRLLQIYEFMINSKLDFKTGLGFKFIRFWDWRWFLFLRNLETKFLEKLATKLL